MTSPAILSRARSLKRANARAKSRKQAEISSLSSSPSPSPSSSSAAESIKPCCSSFFSKSSSRDGLYLLSSLQAVVSQVLCEKASTNTSVSGAIKNRSSSSEAAAPSKTDMVLPSSSSCSCSCSPSSPSSSMRDRLDSNGRCDIWERDFSSMSSYGSDLDAVCGVISRNGRAPFPSTCDRFMEDSSGCSSSSYEGIDKIILHGQLEDAGSFSNSSVKVRIHPVEEEEDKHKKEQGGIFNNPSFPSAGLPNPIPFTEENVSCHSDEILPESRSEARHHCAYFGVKMMQDPGAGMCEKNCSTHNPFAERSLHRNLNGQHQCEKLTSIRVHGTIEEKCPGSLTSKRAETFLALNPVQKSRNCRHSAANERESCQESRERRYPTGNEHDPLQESRVRVNVHDPVQGRVHLVEGTSNGRFPSGNKRNPIEERNKGRHPAANKQSPTDNRHPSANKQSPTDNRHPSADKQSSIVESSHRPCPGVNEHAAPTQATSCIIHDSTANEGDPKPEEKSTRCSAVDTPNLPDSEECVLMPPDIQSLAGEDSVAIAKLSLNPHEDFRESMYEMILDKDLEESVDLEELLFCYLSLNPTEHHNVIREVFSDVWSDIVVRTR